MINTQITDARCLGDNAASVEGLPRSVSAYQLTDEYQDQHDRFLAEWWETRLAAMPAPQAARERHDMAVFVEDVRMQSHRRRLAERDARPTLDIRGGPLGSRPARAGGGARGGASTTGRRSGDEDDGPARPRKRRGRRRLTVEEVFDRAGPVGFHRNADAWEREQIENARKLAHFRDPVNGVAEFDAGLRISRITMRRDGGQG
jgi:hypothetical protein